MPITRHHSGRWYYQFDRVIAGRRTRANRLLPEGTTRAQALDFDRRETARLFQLATGGQRDDPLIADAVLAYLTQHAHKLKNHAGIVGNLAILEPFYAGKRLADLPAVAESYTKAAQVSPATVRNRLAYLRAACRWAWKKLKLGQHDPAERMILPAVDNARHVYLTRAEVLRIARALGRTYARDVVRVAFYTGMRAGEVLAARPVEFGDSLSLSIPTSKNGQPRIVPVHPRIAHIVRSDWPPAITAWTASKAFKAAARAVGLGHARLHDLRHSAASEMVNAGVDLYTVGGVLGHKSQQSTARYAHLAQDRLRQAVGRIGAAKKSHPEGVPKAA